MKYTQEALNRCAQLLSERRSRALAEAEHTQHELYHKLPRLLEIDRQLSQTGLIIVRSILAHDPETGQKVEALRLRNEQLQAEKKTLLSGVGLTEEALEPRFSCPRCEDTGYDAKGQRCSCFETLLKQDAYNELAKASPLQLSDFSAFSLSYYPKTPAENGTSPYNRMMKVFAFCKDYAADFSLSSPSLLFTGKTGLGKTHLALAIAKACIQKNYGVIYNSCQNLMSRLEQEHFSKEHGTDFYDTVAGCDLLILDDLGTEFYTSFVGSMLYSLLNARLSAGLPVIISTNLTPEEMEERYSDRLVSRIFSSYRCFLFLGSDIRMQKAKKG